MILTMEWFGVAGELLSQDMKSHQQMPNGRGEKEKHHLLSLTCSPSNSFHARCIHTHSLSGSPTLPFPIPLCESCTPQTPALLTTHSNPCLTHAPRRNPHEPSPSPLLPHPPHRSMKHDYSTYTASTAFGAWGSHSTPAGYADCRELLPAQRKNDI